MAWIKDYEKRAFFFLGCSFIWSLAWIFATWSYLNWFGIPKDSWIMNWVGVIILAGYIWLMVNIIGELAVGQFKTLFLNKPKDKVE